MKSIKSKTTRLNLRRFRHNLKRKNKKARIQASLFFRLPRQYEYIRIGKRYNYRLVMPKDFSFKSNPTGVLRQIDLLSRRLSKEPHF